MTPTTLNSRDRIFQSFEEILTRKKQQEYQVATKEEEAEKAKNIQLLAVTKTYTIDNIVRALADLQLDFSNIINTLSERLETEAEKLEQLQQAIAIETQIWQQLQQVRIVADALHLLRQEHQEKIRATEHKISNKAEALEKEMAQTHLVWQQEQQEFDMKIQEAQELQQKQRQQAESDFTYERERQRTIDTDCYEQKKRAVEKDIADRSGSLEKAWMEREQILSANQAIFAENQMKVAGFEEELKQAYLKAKDDAIQDVTREEKVKADLFEKEWQSNQQSYEIKIAALEATIQGQNEQIQAISLQLQEATKQAKDLAQLAFSSPLPSGGRGN